MELLDGNRRLPIPDDSMPVESSLTNYRWLTKWTTRKHITYSKKPPQKVRTVTGWSAKDIDKNNSTEKKFKRRWLPYIGAVLCVCGLLTYIFDPVEMSQEWGMRIAPNSRYLKIWMDPPVTVYAKIYIFNVTNAEKFLANEEKLKLEEIGPFVYIESLKHTEINFDKNGTMSYMPRRSATFVRELSVADPSTMRVVVPNIALLGLGSMMADSSMITNSIFMSFTKYKGWKPFLNMAVEQYFWGYDDPLVQMANKLAGFWIPFSKLGILDRMYDEGDSKITVRLQDNGLSVTDPGYLHQYSIDTWDGSPGLTKWGYTDNTFSGREEPLKPGAEEKCKLIRGATEGILFPRHLDPKMPFYAYRKTFCRTTRVEFKRRDFFLPGIIGHWYGLPDDVFDTPEMNPEQKCFCNSDRRKCLPKGLSDITPCYWNIPAAVSFPHFYNGDPALVQAIDGLKPDKAKHESYAVIQPELGSVIDFTSRIQTNLVMKNIRYNADLIPFANLHLPFFWCELLLWKSMIFGCDTERITSYKGQNDLLDKITPASNEVEIMKLSTIPVDFLLYFLTAAGLDNESVISLYVLLLILPATQTTSIILGCISAIYLNVIFMIWLYKRFIITREPAALQKVIENPLGVKLDSNLPD